ncbi:MAG: hypothetical protein RMY28_003640 [Nostoc sp. ChiSLP01]
MKLRLAIATIFILTLGCYTNSINNCNTSLVNTRHDESRLYK